MQVKITLELATWDKNEECYDLDVVGLGPYFFALDKIYAKIQMTDVQGRTALKEFTFTKTRPHSDIVRQITNWLASDEAAQYFKERAR